jgi:hypothetical protein
VDDTDDHTVRFCSTGGWLLKADGEEFVGADVVVFENLRAASEHETQNCRRVSGEEEPSVHDELS